MGITGGNITNDPSPDLASIPLEGGIPSDGDTLIYSSSVNKWLYAPMSGGSGGSGDMLRAVYDVNSDGVVDRANAVSLDGIPLNLTTIVDGSTLTFNGITGLWEAEVSTKLLSHVGNPNGVLPAPIGTRCLDTLNQIIWTKMSDPLNVSGWYYTV